MVKTPIPNFRGKVVILGVGNVMKRDDGAGPELVKKLNGKLKASLIDCGPAPENYTGKIRDKRPDTILIVDAVDFGGKPGSIKVIDPENMKNETFSTHNVSLKVFSDFIKNETNAEIIILGIQPENVSFGIGLSQSVLKALSNIEEKLLSCTKLG